MEFKIVETVSEVCEVCEERPTTNTRWFREADKELSVCDICFKRACQFCYQHKAGESSSVDFKFGDRDVDICAECCRKYNFCNLCPYDIEAYEVCYICSECWKSHCEHCESWTRKRHCLECIVDKF